MRPEYLLPLPVISALWLFFLNSGRLLAEDRILRCLYRDHPDIWESLGSPNGWQWSPPGRFAVPWRMWSSQEWHHVDPDWLSRAPELRQEFQEIRAFRRRILWPALPTFGGALALFAIGTWLFQHH